MTLSVPEHMPAFMPGALPENLQTNLGSGAGGIDFDSLLQTSNEAAEKERTKNGSDGLQIGETKDEKVFREQLEKVTGQKQSKIKNKLEQNDYLTLLVTQLKYQDPAKPMEQAEMASQMAQMNTVQQLIGMNGLLKDIKQQNAVQTAEKFGNYMGKSVEIKDNSTLEWNKDTQQSTSSIVKIDQKAAQLQMNLVDSEGNIVRTWSQENAEIGEHSVDFDGKDTQGNQLPSGRYKIQAQATSEDGKPITLHTSAIVEVTGVKTDAEDKKSILTPLGAMEPEKIASLRMKKEKITQ